MSIRIANNDISVVVRGYAIAPYPVDPPEDKAHDEGEEKGKAKGKSKPAAKPAARPDQIERENVLVWVELAPGHPKAVGAIWATLVNGAGAFLEITDRESGRRHRARGLNRRNMICGPSRGNGRYLIRCRKIVICPVASRRG